MVCVVCAHVMDAEVAAAYTMLLSRTMAGNLKF